MCCCSVTAEHKVQVNRDNPNDAKHLKWQAVTFTSGLYKHLDKYKIGFTMCGWGNTFSLSKWWHSLLRTIVRCLSSHFRLYVIKNGNFWSPDWSNRETSAYRKQFGADHFCLPVLFSPLGFHFQVSIFTKAQNWCKKSC